MDRLAVSRPTADIIADMRRPGSVVEWWMKDVRREAADRLAELDDTLPDWKSTATKLWRRLGAIDALRPPCPRCGGVGFLCDTTTKLDRFGRCPDCVDGKVSIEQLVATWRAVWAFEMQELQWGDEYDAGAQAAIEQIRQAKP